MSEEQTSGATQNKQANESVNIGAEQEPDQRGPGAILKQARESRGLHIAALAVLLKVPVKKLEALESDRFDSLPDSVFVRALASSVCRTLKIDPVPILARLPQTDAPRLGYQGTGINAPFLKPGDRAGPSVWAQVSRPAVLAGMLLLLGALVLIFLPTIKTGISSLKIENADSGSGINTARTENRTPIVALFEVGSPDARISGDSPQLAPTTTLGTAVVSGLAGSVDTAVAISGPPAADKGTLTQIPSNFPQTYSSNNSAVLSSSTVASKAGAPQASDVVVFTAKAESWVEVTDARNRVVLRRVVAAGEAVGASGVMPLKVVVGRADITEVQVRGKVFDLSVVAKDNVARFEVN